MPDKASAVLENYSDVTSEKTSKRAKGKPQQADCATEHDATAAAQNMWPQQKPEMDLECPEPDLLLELRQYLSDLCEDSIQALNGPC